MTNILSLFSQYELLTRTASYLSTVDLYRTAMTCSVLYGLIRQSDAIFASLKKVGLCDGSGLRARQTLAGFYHPNDCWGGGKESQDAKHDETNAPPCVKCGINTCHECRRVPRRRKRCRGWAPSRRPHFEWRNLKGTYPSRNVMTYCAQCDPAINERTRGQLCDCDRYTRWICMKCAEHEATEESWYRDHCTVRDGLMGDDPSTCCTLVNHHIRFQVSLPS